MFESFNKLAETAATGASRRQFLGRLGRGAMVAALAAGSLLTMTQNATAAKRCTTDSDCPKNRSCIDGRCVKGPKCERC